MRDARATLKALLLAGARDKILEAAAAGETRATLLAFEASDEFADSGLQFLFLVKGDRDRALDPGPSILQELRREVRPFAVAHEWQRGTASNLLEIVFA